MVILTYVNVEILINVIKLQILAHHYTLIMIVWHVIAFMLLDSLLVSLKF